ncbi:class I SAM-dependent methyltransferase [Aquirufa rosea]|uniref:Methyltransferase domain-containing protein n=1 Tax=Aquirufa rosea TaxID=2509241 RepID=A0A4Q1C0U4_9BACT|nr:methyltransferase domain-containing protein [Aquirufa rosea]RXK50706.1 methyltransferase domain-containing protein [Aquirufa rosea]
MKQLLEHFAWNPTDRLLSLGCGSAWWEANLILHQTCQEIILVDTNAEVLNPEHFKENIDYFEKKLEKKWECTYQIFNQSLEQLPLDKHHIDGVWVFNAWHELDTWDTILPALKNILKPEGWILIEEELSLQERRFHEGCGKKLLYLDELNEQMKSISFRLNQQIWKDQQSCYLKYQKA